MILGAWAVARLLSDREQGKVAIKGFVVAMVLFIVTLAPLLAHYVELPEGATSRPPQVFLFSEENRGHVVAAYGTSDPTELLVMNAARIGRFLVGKEGDRSVQYGLQGQFFDPYLLPLFLAGLAYALILVRQPGGQLLWIWFLGTMTAGGLLTIDAIFSPRLIGVTAIVLLFPALLIDRLMGARWIADRRWLRTAVTLIFGALLLGSTWWNLQTTFVRYPPKSRISNRDRIVRIASDLGDVRTIANFSDPEDFDHQAYRALIPDIEGMNLRHGKESISHPIATVETLPPRRSRHRGSLGRRALWPLRPGRLGSGRNSPHGRGQVRVRLVLCGVIELMKREGLDYMHSVQETYSSRHPALCVVAMALAVSGVMAIATPGRAQQGCGPLPPPSGPTIQVSPDKFRTAPRNRPCSRGRNHDSARRRDLRSLGR